MNWTEGRLVRTGKGRGYCDWKSRKSKLVRAGWDPADSSQVFSSPLGPREVMDEPNLYKRLGLFIF